MKRNIFCARLLAGICALTGANALRADTSFPIMTDAGSGVTLKLTSPLTTMPRFGFLPVRFTVENASQRDGVWTLHFTAGEKFGFPGVLETDLTVAAAAGQTRETWFFVPLAEAGVPATGTPATTSTGMPLPLPTSPTPIPGVYPIGRPDVKETWTVSRTSGGSSGTTTFGTRVFTITQSGPASALPNPPSAPVPTNTKVSLNVDTTTGTAVRTLTQTHDLQITTPGSAAGGSRFVSPTNQARENAEKKLRAAGMWPASGYPSISMQSNPGDRPNTNRVILTIRQTGAAADLPLITNDKLPSGFIDVEVNPAATPGEVVRTFTYKETVDIAPGTRGGVTPIVRPSVPSLSTAEADARKVLAGLKLLDPIPSVTQRPPTSSIVSAGSVVSYVTAFFQTGPSAVLPQPLAAALPPGVLVTLLPGPSTGLSTRVITYVDPALLGAMAASPGGTASSMTNSRIELMRRGLLLNQPGVRVTSPRPTAMTGGSAFSAATSGMLTLGSVETGPSAMLPLPPQSVLPPGVTASVKPTSTPGEVERTLTIPLSLTGGAPVTMRTMTNYPMSIGFETSGPGLSRTQSQSIGAALVTANGLPPLAVSASQEAVLKSKLSLVAGRTGLSISGVDFAGVPADWRVWSSFHGAVLTTAEYEALDPARRLALRQWVALGGQLFLVPDAAGTAQTDRIGAGQINRLPDRLAQIDAADLRDQLHLGTLALSLPERDALRIPEKSPLASVLLNFGRRNSWLAVFLIAFALIVGPVNLMYFAPAKKRHRMFITTPLISFFGAVGLAGAILLQDGTGGAGARRAVVVLLPGENTAAVFQEQASRTGLLTGREFALDDDTIMAGITVDEYNPSGRGSSLSRNMGRADGDWFRNRYAQAHHLRRLVPTRGRIEQVGTSVDDAPIVESTFGTTLRDFALVAPDGQIWTAPELSAGKRVTLVPEVGSRWIVLSGAGGSSHLDEIFAAAAPRQPGYWVARGGESDLAPIQTLKNVKWTDTGVVYTGQVEKHATGKGGAE